MLQIIEKWNLDTVKFEHKNTDSQPILSKNNTNEEISIMNDQSFLWNIPNKNPIKIN